MNIYRVNNLLEEVATRLYSLEEGIERMDDDDDGTVEVANYRLALLLKKLTAGRAKETLIRATGTQRHG